MFGYMYDFCLFPREVGCVFHCHIAASDLLRRIDFARSLNHSSKLERTPLALANVQERIYAKFEENYKSLFDSIHTREDGNHKAFLNLRVEQAFMRIFDDIPKAHAKKWAFANAPMHALFNNDYNPLFLITYCADYASLVKIDKFIGDNAYKMQNSKGDNLLHTLLSGFEQDNLDFNKNLELNFLHCAKFLIKKNPALPLSKNLQGLTPLKYAQDLLVHMKKPNAYHLLSFITYCADDASLAEIDKFIESNAYKVQNSQGDNLLHTLLSGFEQNNLDFNKNLELNFLNCAKFLIKKNPALLLSKNLRGLTPLKYAQQMLEHMQKPNAYNLLFFLAYCADYASFVEIDKFIENNAYGVRNSKGDNLLHTLLSGFDQDTLDFNKNVELNFFNCAKFLIKKNPALLVSKNSQGLLPLNYVQNMLVHMQKTSDRKSWTRRHVQERMIDYLQGLIKAGSVHVEVAQVTALPSSSSNATGQANLTRSGYKDTSSQNQAKDLPVRIKPRENHLLRMLLNTDWSEW